jgi:hypothetical protein
MDNVVGDCTVRRHLHAMGWWAAEEAGLNEKMAAYLDAERMRAPVWQGSRWRAC